MDKRDRNAVAETVAHLLDTGAHRVVKYLSPRRIVRATRILDDKKLPGKGRNTDLRVVIGAPNYLERTFISVCRKAGEPFPIKKPQVQPVPTPRKKKAR